MKLHGGDNRESARPGVAAAVVGLLLLRVSVLGELSGLRDRHRVSGPREGE